MKKNVRLDEIPKSDLDRVEKYADNRLNPVDVQFTRHFFDRLQDPRNITPISQYDLLSFFRKLSRNKQQFIDFLKKYKQFVVTDGETNINIPFVRNVNRLIAKTIMRKRRFTTPNARYMVEAMMEDRGTEPYVVNIDDLTINNTNYRTTHWTGKHLQMTVMSIDDEIGLEKHDGLDQFLRIEKGEGLVQMGLDEDNLDFEQEVGEDDAVFVPGGYYHNITNTGDEPIKLYAIYAPIQHKKGRVDVSRPMEENERDYKKEYRNYHSKPKQKKRRAERNHARRKMEKEGRVRKGDGKDVHHKSGNTSNNNSNNLQVMSKSKNRAIKESALKINKGFVFRAKNNFDKVRQGLKYVVKDISGSVGDMVVTVSQMGKDTPIKLKVRSIPEFYRNVMVKENTVSTLYKEMMMEYINEELPTKKIDKSKFPNPTTQKGFLKKGAKDGSIEDDILKTKNVTKSVSELKPSQSAIYLGKSLVMAAYGINGGDLGAVISNDNYILDGHHRYAATTFNNPSNTVSGLMVDLSIGDLIPVLRSVGDAFKNKRGLEPSGGDINIFKATMKDVKDAVYKGKNVEPKFYNRDNMVKWFESIGEKEIQKRLKILQSKKPPSAAPPRKDMPRINPDQLGVLKKLLGGGKIDVLPPYANESLSETIKKVDGKYVVYPKKGGKRLGTHDTLQAAKKQLAAIEISKSK